MTRFDATDRRPVDKWTAAPRPTTSPQGQKPQQKRSTHMVHKPVNSECSRQVGLVSVDGSKFEASASKHRSVTYERAGELIDQLKLDIADLMERAAAADGEGEDDPQALPKEIARREALCDRLDAARRRLEARAKARAEAERGTTRPRWRRARRAPAGPRASTRSRPTRRRAPTSRAI